MQQYSIHKLFLMREVFNLIKAKGLQYETTRYCILNLVRVLQNLVSSRNRYAFQKICCFDVTSKLGVALTQSILKIFVAVENKMKANALDAFSKIHIYSKMRKVILDIHQPVPIPCYNTPEDGKIIFLNQRKIIGAMKLLNMFRKISLYDWKTIKTFRKWQLEDLRSLMEGYRRTNCTLFFNMRNTCLYSAMKNVENQLKSILREAMYKLKFHYDEVIHRQNKQLVKLNDILLRKKIVGKVLSNQELQKKLTLKKFLSKLKQLGDFESNKDVLKQNSLRVICYYWRRKMAFCFRKFYLRCFEGISLDFL